MIYIANPIYDPVFKYMMEDKSVAKRFIGIIINKKVVSIELRPQEVTFEAQGMPLVQRLDFVAEIVDENNIKTKVLIEIQKSNKTYHADILRFRGYLAKHYQMNDLPVITIYILGFTLKDLPAPVVHADIEYKDLYYDKKIESKCEFIEKLTHSTYIVQVPRLKLKVKKKLADLLDLFNQKYQVSKDSVGRYTLKIPYSPKDKDIKQIVKRLEKAGANEELRDKIANQEIAEMMYEEMFGEKDRKITTLSNALEQERQQAEQEKQRAEQEKQVVIKSIEKLRNMGMNDKEIEQTLGIDIKNYI